MEEQTHNKEIKNKKDVDLLAPHFLQYWDDVKNVVDKDGWVYSKDVPHLLDSYFEHNTGKDIQFEKHYEGEWRGYRWRPKSLLLAYIESKK